jgi:fumarylacetoacetase
MALPRSSQQHTRAMLRSLLSSNLITLPFGSTAHLDEATLHLPVSCGDFTDFSCSREHVLNAGEAIQGKRRLPPGFFHFPIGYEGRSSSIVVSGTPVVRPMGQFRNALGEVVYGASEKMDYELEIACIVGKPSQLGAGIQSQDADDHIFGFVLLNDWSGERSPFMDNIC